MSLLVCLIILWSLCGVAWVKNNINYRIHMKWIDEVYEGSDWKEKSLVLSKISYNKTFRDIKLWSYIPFDEYVQSRLK